MYQLFFLNGHKRTKDIGLLNIKNSPIYNSISNSSNWVVAQYMGIECNTCQIYMWNIVQQCVLTSILLFNQHIVKSC